jgi:hypothetical protein
MGPDAFARVSVDAEEDEAGGSKSNNKSVAVKLLHSIPKESLYHYPFGATPHPNNEIQRA